MTAYRWLRLLAVAIAFGSASIGSARAQAVLSGQVSSADEGAMEGVLVSAKRIGSNVTVTVVTDPQGRFSFPAGRLEAGPHAVTTRATGFDLPRRVRVDVTAQTAPLDLKLVRARDLAGQLSNAEWLESMPGTREQKLPFLGCVSCHSLERIVRSKYDADGFMQTIQRMSTYANQSTPLRPQLRLAQRDREVMVGEDMQRVRRENAQFFSTVNLNGGSTWDYDLKPFPRLKGRSTKMIVTEYDLPRLTIEPHDVIVDKEGIAWYSNFGEQFMGRLDTRTGKHVEYPMPEVKKGWPQGALSIRFDRDENLWLGMMYQAAIARFDKKTEKFQIWPIPAELNSANTQINMTSPLNIGVDGKVWTQNNGRASVHRVDLATGKWETFEPFKTSSRFHNIYDVISDSKNNGWFTDFGNQTIGRIDAKSGKVTLYDMSTLSSAPRRGMMDDQERIWFGQYRANRIGMFDTKTERSQEWVMPTPWSAPYDVTVDRNGYAWTGSMLTDRVLRMDTKTGEFVEYQLPRPTNIRRVFVDNRTNPPTFWVGSNHGASIVKLEALD